MDVTCRRDEPVASAASLLPAGVIDQAFMTQNPEKCMDFALTDMRQRTILSIRLETNNFTPKLYFSLTFKRMQITLPVSERSKALELEHERHRLTAEKERRLMEEEKEKERRAEEKEYEKNIVMEVVD